jgi:hypothetical protein
MCDTFYSSFVEVQRKIEKNYALFFNGQYSARKGIILYLEYHSVCPSSETELGPPTPSPTSKCVTPPPPKKQGGATLACGGGGGRTQFGRLETERKLGFLSTL